MVVICPSNFSCYHWIDHYTALNIFFIDYCKVFQEASVSSLKGCYHSRWPVFFLPMNSRKYQNFHDPESVLISSVFTKILNEALCAIWDHVYNLKNVKSTHGVVLLLVKLHAKVKPLFVQIAPNHANHLKCTINMYSKRNFCRKLLESKLRSARWFG